MPDLTPTINLKKPLGNETVNRAAYAENLDLIDAAALVAKNDLQAHLDSPDPHPQAGYYDFPIGAIIFAAYETPPEGWLECNGAAVSRTAFPELFARIGTRFGIGDGTVTFNLPDLRGEFIRGWDHGRGIDTGRVLGSRQISTQVFVDDDNAHVLGIIDWTYNNLTNLGYESRDISAPSTINQHFVNTTATNPSAPSDYFLKSIRPRNIALMPIIKAKNVQGSDPAVHQANADTLDGLHAADFMPVGSFNNHSLGSAGYQALPGGLVLQWGKNTVNANTTAVFNFPITFPGEVFMVLAGPDQEKTTADYTVSAHPVSKSQYSLSNTCGTAKTISWVALGR
jgi:microcystin-dependent protein